MCGPRNHAKARYAAPAATMTPITLEAPYGPGPYNGPAFAAPHFQTRRGGCRGGRGRRGGPFAMMFRAMKEKQDARYNQNFENSPIVMMESEEPRRGSGYGYAPKPENGTQEKEHEGVIEARNSQNGNETSMYRASIPPPSYETSEKSQIREKN